MIPSQKFIKPSQIVLDINDLNNVTNESMLSYIYFCILQMGNINCSPAESEYLQK